MIASPGSLRRTSRRRRRSTATDPPLGAVSRRQTTSRNGLGGPSSMAWNARLVGSTAQ